MGQISQKETVVMNWIWDDALLLGFALLNPTLYLEIKVTRPNLGRKYRAVARVPVF
jgi:hypothetical protein